TVHVVPDTRSSTIRSPATIHRSLHAACTTAALVPSGDPEGRPSWTSLRSSSVTAPVEMSSLLSTAEYQSSSLGCALVMASTCPGPHQGACQTFSPSGDTLLSAPESGVYSQRLRQASSGGPASTSGYQGGSPDSPSPTVPDPCASAISAPSPATPSRMRVPS